MPRSILVNTADVAPQTGISNPFQHIQATPDAFGAQIGDALARSGRMSMETSDRLGEHALQLAQLNNDAVARDAFNKASEAYRVKSVTDGVYSKTPGQLYGDGSKPEDVYKKAREEYEAAGKEFAGQVKNPRAQLIFNKAWGEHANTELGRAASFAATSHRQYMADTAKSFLLQHSETVGQLGTQVENDWRNWRGADQAAANNLQIGLKMGVPVDDIAKEAKANSALIKSAAIRGWFKEQTDPDSAAEQLYSGKLSDPEAQKIYEALDPKSREQLYRGLLEDRHKLAVIHNTQRLQAEREEKETANKQVSAFFFGPRQTADQLQQRLDALQSNVHVPLETKMKMQQYIRDGGRDSGVDVEADNLDVERAIRADQLKTDSEVLNYIAENGLQVSVNTARTRLLPLIEAKRDKKFSGVLDWGESELGYDKSAASASDPLGADKAIKARKFRADMIAIREQSPDADLWSEARRIVSDLKKQGNTTALSGLPIMTQNYRDALATKDPKKIAAARAALIATMGSGGMVDPMTAARSDFDPLSVIDNPDAQNRSRNR